MTPKLAAGGLQAVLLVTAAGCGGQPSADTPDAGISVRDSAGIEIVDHGPGQPSDAVWSLSGPVLSIGGGPDDDRGLFDVGRMAAMAGGRFVVAHPSGSEVVWFAADGRRVAASGREGEGPGEFLSIGMLFVSDGDSVVAWDGRLNRISIFGPDGGFVRSAPLDLAAAGHASPVALLSDGTLVGLPGFTFGGGMATGVYRDTVPLTRFHLDGSLAGRTTPFPMTERWVFEYQGSTAGGSLPFGKETRVVAGVGGFWVGTGDWPQVSFHDPSGNLLRIVRWGDSPERLTDGILAEIEAWWLANGDDDPESRADLERYFEMVPYPETIPTHGRLMSDDRGNLWVESYSWPGSPSESLWTAYSPDGRRLGAVEVPEQIRVQAISADLVYGVWTDDLDVESIRVYSIERGPGLP